MTVNQSCLIGKVQKNLLGTTFAFLQVLQAIIKKFFGGDLR